MKNRNTEKHEVTGEVVDEGTTAELLQEKAVAEELLREQLQEEGLNPNDQPGFDDGLEGGWDGEDRQGDPNSVTGSDLSGEVHAGDTASERSGGIDGGPARRTPLKR